MLALSFYKYFSSNTLVSFLEIAIISFVIDYFLASIWNTKTTEALVLVMISFVVLILSQLVGMFALAGVSSSIISLSATVLPILFQQELKLAFSNFGGGNKHIEVEIDLETFIEKLATCAFQMGYQKTGGLIVIERSDSMEPFIQNSALLNAKFSIELIQTIFCRGTPLHDGAIIISGTKILAASVILPLAEHNKSTASRNVGTRHRAGVGISQQTDAFVVIISEETGKVSIAKDGKLTFGVKPDRFKANLRNSLFEI